MFTTIRVLLQHFLSWALVSILSWLGVIECYYKTDFYTTNAVHSPIKFDWGFRAIVFLIIGVNGTLYYRKGTGTTRGWHFNTIFAKDVASFTALISPFLGNVHERSGYAMAMTSCIMLHLYAIIMVLPVLDIGVWDFVAGSYLCLLWDFYNNQVGMKWPWFVIAAGVMFLCNLRNWLHSAAYVPTPLTNAPHSPRIRDELVALVLLGLSPEEMIYLEAMIKND